MTLDDVLKTNPEIQDEIDKIKLEAGKAGADAMIAELESGMEDFKEKESKILEAAKAAEYKRGFKAGKKSASDSENEDDGPKNPECFKAYPHKSSDVGPECRACPFAVECKKVSKK